LLRCTRTENTEHRPARAIINQCLHIRHRISDMFPRPLGRPTLGSMGRVGGDSKCVSNCQLHVVLHNPSGASAPRSLIPHSLPFGTSPQHLGDHTSLGCPVRTPLLPLHRQQKSNQIQGSGQLRIDLRLPGSPPRGYHGRDNLKVTTRCFKGGHVYVCGRLAPVSLKCWSTQ